MLRCRQCRRQVSREHKDAESDTWNCLECGWYGLPDDDQDIYLIIPWGRSFEGVLKDAKAYVQDSYPDKRLHVIVVLRDDDEIPAEVQASYFLRPSEVVGGGRLIYILNGGTTQQQWAIARAYWQHLAGEMAEDPVKVLPGDFAIALDVQRDGVTVLGERHW